MTTPTASTAAGPRDAYAAAAVLGCTVGQVGYCARCRSYCHRYGSGGSPLCQQCQKERDTNLAAK